jgi:hypothetical protein
MAAGGMSFPWADALLSAAMAYMAVGAGVALAFLLFGLDRIDPTARGAYGFRALIGPGLALLWPLVVTRWLIAPAGAQPRSAPRQQAGHRVAWLCLAVIVPAILVASLVQRRASPPANLSERLSAPAAP